MMLRPASVAAVLLALAPASARAAAPAEAAARAAQEASQAPTGMVSLSLIEALTAIKQPNLVGVFAFVAEKNAPFALADLLARDKKSMKLYLDKLDEDFKSAQGLTEWDHEVCASLINLYGSPMANTFGAPEPKRMKQINDCMLAPAIPLEAIVAKRKK
ncbi:MAG TPA: hypothetical protein VN915_02665 [Elusimicrobiota bacterium]|nr:hypothetical protein [Elusimicrobiota bacterium]